MSTASTQIMSVIHPDTFINASLEHKYSAIGEQLLEMHGDKYILNEDYDQIFTS